MLDLSKRISGLSPAGRLLFQRLLERKTISRDDLRSGAQNGTTPVSPGRGETPKTELVFDGDPSPAEAKASYRRFYNDVSAQLDSTEFGEFSFFLNYGYVPNHNPQYTRVQLPDHYLNKNSVRLVLELVGDCALSGRRVLDVGCGRGGSVSVIHRFFAPRMTVGVDLSSAAISFCRKTHRYAGVTFFESDAEALPFREESFEIVTNVESSHSYPNIEKFYSEALRVVTSGGYFLYTDVLPVHRMNECTALLKDIGFCMEREQDITTNVLLSCDQSASLRAAAFGNERNTKIVKEFLGLPGSEVYEQLEQGQCSYKLFKLRKVSRGTRW